MLKCRDIAHQASDYLDQQLTGWQRVRFRIHLLYCYYCRRFVNHLRITNGYLRGNPFAHLSEADKNEVDNILAKIHQHKP